MSIKEDKNKPTEPGFYWARESGYQWWNVIVMVEGESPYLSYRAWDRTEGVTVGKDPSDYYFGPKIEEPEDPIKLTSSERD